MAHRFTRDQARTMTPPSISILLLAIFPAAVIFAAIRDLTTFTIPNWISLVLIVAFFPIALISHLPLASLGASVIIGVLALALGVAMFAVGWIGGGDAKLFAASALWLGWPALLPFLMWTGLAGGALAVTLLWSRKLANHYPSAGPAWFGRLMTPGGEAPYGVAIAIGGLAAFPLSALFHANL
jgi:prepilin peptidase CpaA